MASDLSASGIDFKPTDQQNAVYQVLNKRLMSSKENFDELVTKDIEAFNQQLNALNMKIEVEKKKEAVKRS